MDTIPDISHFSGSISVTNNGISFIPSFSLDKPAVIFNLNVGKGKLSFEPEMRFALAGKPWSFLFWWRYKVIQNDEFSLRFGATHSLNFRTIPVVSYGKSKDVLESRRFLAAEIAPNYKITDKFYVGMYYFFSVGFDDSQRTGHFAVLNTSFPNIKISQDYYLSFYPNVFYLRLDDIDGYYASARLRLSNSKYPIALEAIATKIITSEIAPDRDFLWNLTLFYSFNKRYVDYAPRL